MDQKISVIISLSFTDEKLKQNYEQLDQMSMLRTVLSKGMCGFILTDQNESNSIQLLGFKQQLFDNLQEDLVNQNQSFEQKSQELSQDTQLKAFYIEKNPKFFKDVSSNLRAKVITNSIKIANQCNLIELDYDYQSQINFCQKFDENKSSYDLIIFDYNENENLDSLKNLEKTFLQNLQPNCFLNIVFHGFTHNLQFLNQKYNDVILDLIPQQSYKLMDGLIDQEFKPKQAILNIKYDKMGCRSDTINSFQDLVDEKNFQKFGNNCIRIDFFSREIKFQLNKIPKFGA